MSESLSLITALFIKIRSPNKDPVKGICDGDDKSLMKITKHEIASFREETINGSL